MTLAAGMPKFDPLEYADVLTVSLTKQAGGGRNMNMGGAVVVKNVSPYSVVTGNPGVERKRKDIVAPMIIPDGQTSNII